MWYKYRTSILIGLTFSLLFSTFWFFPSLAFIIFLSLLLNLLLVSSVDRLAKKLPRILSASIILLLFVAVITGFLAMISQTFIPTFTSFLADLPNLSTNIHNLSFIQQSDFAVEQIDALLNELTTVSISALRSSLTLVLALFSRIIEFVIILFVTFYLLKDGNEIKVYLAGLFPHKDYSRILALFDRILKALSIYIFSQLIICFITGTIVFLYFTFFNLPYASVFAVLSGVGEFVPVLGPTIASAFGTILVATQTPWLAFQTMLFYIILTQVNHNIVYPNLIGKSLNLHPIAIILGIIFGGEILGPAGMFLAVPCIVIIKLVIEDIYHDRINNFKAVEKQQIIAEKIPPAHN